MSDTAPKRSPYVPRWVKVTLPIVAVVATAVVWLMRELESKASAGSIERMDQRMNIVERRIERIDANVDWLVTWARSRRP